MESMSNAKAITTFFNTPGYPEVKYAELKAFKDADPKGWEEVAKMCADALGVKIASAA